MKIQKFKVVIELVETKYYEKVFELNSNDFYEQHEKTPQNMYSEIPDLLNEIFVEDFEYISDTWIWDQPAISPRDGVYIDTVQLLQTNSKNATKPT